ncbi:sigma-54-dependent Fis family transcriptional regulator [Cellvibrio zantedeschiae]|uniref:Sigma-54-dependent Fis family transcriptional regulator n=1 Tax=Cellvibrio zantedeschiae TaxID=1237077 RepID=A0ABQ3B5W5_9GAMM|nr:sigma-54 dependent transcriptional regulator [Cellvibrio zantedeschiae]GGY74743.1 sigma-54-dependent Fis family transcriptional regulator [Cellvibrio zantedeschiae]
MAKSLVLVVEDNREIRLSARFVLEDFGFVVAEAETPALAMKWLAQQKADLILLDMNFGLDTTSGEEGLQFLAWLQQQSNDIPVVAMTAWSNTELVVKAMQLGAGDFIEKPWNNQRLHQVLQQQLQLQALNRKNRALSQRLENPKPELVWQSDTMNRLMQQLAAVSSTDANILLTGENGTGKSQLAHWLHLHSARASQAFISVNMGAIPESLFESEMFGHKKGAFTDAKEQRIGRFELAKGGSLFLDEIATIPVAQQAKLLRVLESGEFEMLGSSQTQRTDLRIISATNGDFPQLIADGLFRQDLYYRLNTLEFRIPALRERPEDIAALAAFFVFKHGERYRKPELKLSNSALKAMQAYHWPGNIRELSHMMERAVLLTQSGDLTAEQLALPVSSPQKLNSVVDHFPMMTLEDAELQLIRQALAECEGNKQKTADLLGITKSSLYRRLEKYDLAN